LALHQRIASRLRFAAYLRERRRRPAGDGADRAGPQKNRSLPRLYRELVRAMEGRFGTIALALALLSVATLLKLVPPAATKLVIDGVLNARATVSDELVWRYLPSDPMTRLVWLVVAVLVVSAVGTVLGLWSRWLATRTNKRLQVNVRRRVFEHAIRLPLHRVYQLKSGGASSLLREDAGGVGELVFSMLYNPWRAVVQLVGGLIVLAWVDWRFLLGALFLLPAVWGSDRLWNRRLRPLYKDVRKQRQEIDAKTAEVFGGMRVVRAFARQRTEASRFTGENNLLVRQEVYAWWWSRIVEVLWELLLPVASGALLFYGGTQVLAGRLSLGDLMMFLVYLAMLLEPVAVLATSVTQLQNNLAGFDRVLDLLAEPKELAANPGRKTRRKADVQGAISLREVGYRYPNSEARVLRGIDLDVEPGELIALVGRSGSGKTTLCNLIARFDDPTEGSIALDGTDLREIQVGSYRRLLGIVEQDVFLFDGTIAENIAYADRRASRGQIERAASTANAAGFIEALPEGYDTVIGERGVRLSGGQRQRLAIARAVLADPRLLILDEATSNLDSESEEMIRRGLDELLRGRTSFVIAHRLSTIRNADRILVLDAGSVVESGTHAELMTRSGLYRDMVELQRMGADDL
jgi:ATP-binding cassette subfamily B protein/subfamily B ATP-binding cassette protein MsbA